MDVIERAIDRIAAHFPTPDYADVAKKRDALRLTARTVTAAVRPGGTVLDFGAGAADKTAVLAELGYRCTAVDDLGDYWHARGGRREAILAFAAAAGVVYHAGTLPLRALDGRHFDAVLAFEVLEHLHDSPRGLLNHLVGALSPGGVLVVTVPNALNLRKRIGVVLGRTNYPDFASFFHHPAPWRGHVREYTLRDLEALASFMGLDVASLGAAHTLLWKLPAWARAAYRAATALSPGLRDTLVLVARKPDAWEPVPPPTDEQVVRAVGAFTSRGMGPPADGGDRAR